MSRTKRPIILALDPGKARCGVAISDELGLLAHPRPFFDASERKKLLAAIAALAKEEKVGRILVGLPLDMSGATGPAAKKAVSFAQAVADATGLDVELVDERLSTVEASRKLAEAREGEQTRDRIDGAAAAVFLQAWLEKRPK